MFGLFKKKSADASANTPGNGFDIEAFIAGSIEGLRQTTAAHSATWQLGKEKTWNVDQDTGKVVFSFADGTTATSDVQIVGTWNANDSTFLWGWDHPSVEAPLQLNAARVKAFGELHGNAELSTRKNVCAEARTWDYTALAMRLSEASGAYRAEAAPGTWVYLNFGEVTLARQA